MPIANPARAGSIKRPIRPDDYRILFYNLGGGARGDARRARSRRLVRPHLLKTKRQPIFPIRQRNAETPAQPIAGEP
jgi:hypothetical protein